MLRLAIKVHFILFSVFFISCNNQDNEQYKKAKQNIGEKEYNAVYNKINDTVKIWSLNNLGYYRYLGRSKNYFIDSLVCFNNTNTRLITCILQQNLIKETNNDGIDFVYGEKVDGLWYFFSGPFITVPRESFKDHDVQKPLSYQQLHQIALQEVYNGYLKSSGEINEAWFTGQFEGPGWGDFNNQQSLDFILKGKRFTNKKDFFEFAHLTVVKANWNGVNKDSIKQLPQKNNLP